MDFLEKISAFTLQVATASYSWYSILASTLFITILAYLHYSHATIFNMNDTITTFITWMSLFTLYLLIHKICSSIGDVILAFRAERKNEAELKKQQEQDKQTLLHLSPREIGLLKFMLSQDCNSAWLPPNDKLVIFLTLKHCIKQLDFLESKTITTNKGSISVSLFSVTDTILSILWDMPQELAEKWRKAKNNKIFAKYQ